MSLGFFNNSRNVNVLGGSFNQINGAQETVVEHLRKFAVPVGLHDSGEPFDRPKCHENTRIAVLDRLNRWTLGKIDREKSMLWLYGDAGAGKSAIGQTLAEHCAKEKRLLGSFFFSKNDVRRHSHTPLVATLVYYAAATVKALKDPISTALQRDPRIFEKSLEAQLAALLIGPINKLFESSSFIENSLPNILIIDGLDECSDPAARSHILHILSTAAQTSNFPLKILIASRPETDVSSAFNANPLSALAIRIALDATFKPEADIKLFLESTFEKIKAVHPLKSYIPRTWPGEDLDKLVEKSSGQFIYASVVAKYISSERHKPVDRLGVVLGLIPVASDRDLPFADLDALYHEVLSGIPDEHVEIVFTLLRHLTFMPEMPYRVVHHRMPTASFLSLSPDEPELYLGPLISVLDWKTHLFGLVKFSHASFREFLLDPRRSKHFHISQSAFFVEVLKMSLEHLKRWGPNWEGCFNILRALDLLTFLWEKVDSTPEIRENALNFSFLSISVVLRETPLYFQFIDGAAKFISLLRNSPGSQALYAHHLKSFDACMTVILENLSPNDSDLLITTVLGLKHAILNEDEFVFNEPIILKKLFRLDVVPESIGPSHPLDYLFQFLPTWLFGDVDGPAVNQIFDFFHDPSRSGEYVLDGKRYAAAALACFESLCEGDILNSSSDKRNTAGHRWKYRAGSHLEGLLRACAYIPQLLERSCLSRKLAEYIRAGRFVKMYGEKKLPDVYLCSNFNPEDLIPSVIQASEDYLKLFDSRRRRW